MKCVFKDILEIKNGKNQKNVENSDGVYPIYGSGGIMGYADDYICPSDTVIIGRKGNINSPIYVEEPFWNVDTAFGLIANRKYLIAKYLFYFCKKFNFEKLNKAVTIPSLTKSDLLEIKIDLPDKSSQQLIVDRLNTVERVIELRQQELSQLDNLIKARFIELFGDPGRNPFEWKKTTIKHLVNVKPQNGLYKPQSDYVQDKSGVPILRIDAFYDGKVTSFERLKRLVCSDADKNRYLLKENDIVINRVNSIEYLGKCAHITGMHEDTVFESNMMRFHLDDEQINPVFMTRLLCSKHIYNQILRTAKKAVNQASINQKDVLGLEVYVPPLELQQQFADFVAEVDKSKAAVQKALDETQLLFDSLMQEYFG